MDNYGDYRTLSIQLKMIRSVLIEIIKEQDSIHIYITLYAEPCNPLDDDNNKSFQFTALLSGDGRMTVII